MEGLTVAGTQRFQLVPDLIEQFFADFSSGVGVAGIFQCQLGILNFPVVIECLSDSGGGVGRALKNFIILLEI